MLWCVTKRWCATTLCATNFCKPLHCVTSPNLPFSLFSPPGPIFPFLCSTFGSEIPVVFFCLLSLTTPATAHHTHTTCCSNRICQRPRWRPRWKFIENWRTLRSLRLRRTHMLVNSDPDRTSIVSQVINEVITSVIQIKFASEPVQEFDSSKIRKNATFPEKV